MVKHFDPNAVRESKAFISVHERLLSYALPSPQGLLYTRISSSVFDLDAIKPWHSSVCCAVLLWLLVLPLAG